jgi:iron complex outermembrane receptor protein
VTNLTDEEYFPASYSALWVAPGAPQQFQIRASYEF